MKNIIFVLLVFISTLNHADEGQQVTVQEFKEFASQTMGTMSYYEFKGVVDGKAVLIHHEMSMFNSSKWSKTEVWVRAEELTNEYIQSLIQK